MSGEKTEEPTPKKLRDARKKGQVAKSKEISSTAGIIAVVVIIWALSDWYLQMFQELLLFPAEVYNMEFKSALQVVTWGLALQGSAYDCTTGGCVGLCGRRR